MENRKTKNPKEYPFATAMYSLFSTLGLLTIIFSPFILLTRASYDLYFIWDVPLWIVSIYSVFVLILILIGFYELNNYMNRGGKWTEKKQ